MSAIKESGVKRVLLKISGESLSGVGERDFDREAVDYVAEEIAAAATGSDVQLAVVVGGGNLIRGSRLVKELGTTPVISDQAGMLATLVNAVILQDFLEHKHNVEVNVATALEADAVAAPYQRRKVMSNMGKGKVVILAGGTGTPRFTTDTGAVLKAIEIEADLVLKATKVDGVYDKDPNADDGASAKKIETISHREVLDKNLKIMDLTAATLAEENGIDIRVFNMFEKGNLKKVLSGEKLGSLITTPK